MKQILFLLALAFCTTVNAQQGLKTYYTWVNNDDTLAANTEYAYEFGTDLFGTNNRPQEITNTWSYNITAEIDSISGAAADSTTFFIQSCNCQFNSADTLWYNVSTYDYDGTATALINYVGDVTSSRFRVLMYSKSGTKAVRFRAWATFKKKYPR